MHSSTLTRIIYVMLAIYAEVDRKMLRKLVAKSVHVRRQSRQYPNTYGSRKFGISEKKWANHYFVFVPQKLSKSRLPNEILWIFFHLIEWKKIKNRKFCTLTWDLANAKIKMPENLVNVIPERTLLPIFEIASLARSSFEPSALQNARTICDTNSTPIPMHYI